MLLQLQKPREFLFVCLLMLPVLSQLGNRCLGQDRSTQVLSLSRTGGQVGTEFDLRIVTGNRLEEIETLHFSNPTISASLKSLDPLPFSSQRVPQYGNFQVTLPAELPAGRYEVRAGGRHGISNPRAFLISDLPNEVPAAISHDADAPTELKQSTLVHAKATPAEFDFFRFVLEEQQAIQFELFAQQLDSRMIGQLKLFDAQHREIASARGADDRDPVLRPVGELAAGEYLLAVNDFLYRGGDEYHYQVLVRPVDHVGNFLESQGSDSGRLPSCWTPRCFAVVDQQYSGIGGADLPESNRSTPQQIEIPFQATQWFADRQGETVFEFNATEGERLAIEVASQRAGQPTDPRLIVHRVEPQEGASPKLHELLNVDDCQNMTDGAINLFSTDPITLFQAPVTSHYRVEIRDLDVGKSLSQQQSFRLRIGPPQPGFDLIAYRPYPNKDAQQTQPIGSKLERDGVDLIRVFAVRRDGWGGPIRVRCEGLPEGVTANESIIAANQSQTQLVLHATDAAKAGTTPIRMIGTSEDGSIERQAKAATIQWAKGAGRDFIQSRLTSSLWVCVSEKDISPISISFGDGSIVDVKKGEALKLPIKLVRREGGKAACVLRPRDFAKGIKAGEVTIPADKNEGEIEIKVETAADAGTYSLWLQCETKIKTKSNPQALERAQQYRQQLQMLQEDPAQAANLEAIQSAIAEADKRVEAAKGGAKEQEQTVFIPAPNATIRVVEP